MNRAMKITKYGSLPLLLAIVAPALAVAEEAAKPALNSGDTAWMLTSTALVLFMTIPGLSLFYAGMVRAKNVLSVMMQCFAITALVTVLWTLYGYSLAFDTTGMTKEAVNLYTFIGGLGKAFLGGVTRDSLTLTIPETVFMTFQMTFAIITPALIVGAFAERMKFSALLSFMAIWFTVVYAPVAHMVWSGDGALMWDWGVLDFAGGTVVHINAGIAGFVACLMLGKRKGYPQMAMPPHNLNFTIIGAAMLWVGWFGFNAGSAVAADANAGMECGYGDGGDPNRDRHGGVELDVRRVADPRQTQRTGYCLRRGSGFGGDYPGVRHGWADGRAVDWLGGRRDLFPGLHQTQASSGLRRFARRVRRTCDRRYHRRHSDRLVRRR